MRRTSNQINNRIRWSILLFVSILVLLWTDGLNLKIFDLTDDSKVEWSKNYVVFLLIFATLGYAIFTKRRIEKSWQLKSLLIIGIIIMIPIIFTSIRLYDQPISVLWRRPFLFGGYLIFPFLILTQLSKKEASYLFYLLMLIPAIGSLLCFLGYFIPFIYNLFTDSDLSSRFGMTRLVVAPNFTKLLLFFSIAVVLNTDSFLKKAFFSVLLLMIFWVIINIWLTRQAIYGIFGSIALIWFIRTRSFQKIFSGLLVIVIITSFMTLFQDQLFSLLLKNISLLNELTADEISSHSGTIGMRLAGLKYYFDLFLKTKLIGVGMSVSESMFDPVSKAGWFYRFNTNDLGIFGMIYHFGLPVPIFLFFIFKRLFRDLKRIIARSDSSTKIMADSILMFLLGELAGLIFTKAFLYANFAFFYGLILYFSWRLLQPDIAAKSDKQKMKPGHFETPINKPLLMKEYCTN